jgi:hypothetical protein
MKNKKGELTTQQLVTIIILIISFVIVLFLLWRLGLDEISNKEVCHNSVILNEKSSVLSNNLDCRTTYVCISGGGNCEEFVVTNTIKVSSEEEINPIIQKEIDDCWWMFGEGKIKYLGWQFPNREVFCAICSTIKFKGVTDFNFGNNLIEVDEEYSVVTGIRENAPGNFKKSNIFEPVIVKSNEIESKVGCTDYISKA